MTHNKWQLLLIRDVHRAAAFCPLSKLCCCNLSAISAALLMLPTLPCPGGGEQLGG
jgi:hypothetical protein